ncbi:MAG: hypothetical protein H7343_22890 [Undibacterium sp.]|nr:hypothetical protein [Opitutaceae bacterium]
MPARRPSRSSLMLVTALLALTARSHGQLSANSPFMPAAASGSAVVTEGAAIELRGVMETKEGVSFCIFDPAKKVSTWTRLNQKGLDFLVKSYDPVHETVSVDYAGRTITLAMRAVKVVSSGQASAPMPLPAPGIPSAVTQNVVLNPTPADEQARLEAVATEVRRRRALREQASIQAATGVQPVVEAPAGQPQQQRAQAQGQNQNRRQRN